MHYFHPLYLPLLIVLALSYSAAVTAVDISGRADLELTAYHKDGQFARQDYRYNAAIAVEPEFYWEWADGDDSLTFTPFVRADEHDFRRSRGDIRELSWVHVGEQWEFRTGVRKVFWGVAEFNHLVDVINQTDSVESFDGEEKLGQPMINASRVMDWGVVDFFILTGFRERTFSGQDGRLRSGTIIDDRRALYESADEEHHIDYAVRWNHSFNVFDVGLYWFDGTDRTPIFQSQTNGGVTTFVPFYQQITQVGLDAQITIDSWLWKFEGLQKRSRLDDYVASQAGFEYTFYGVNESAADVGVLLEYGWDERNTNAVSNTAQNDISLGARFTLNDTNDTALLVGMSYDVDFHSRSLLIEASQRLNDYWTVSLEGLLFESNSNLDSIAAIDDDDRIQLTLERYF